MGSVTEWMASDRPAIIYGAGRQAEAVYEHYCLRHKKPCLAIMTTGDSPRAAGLPDESRIPAARPDTWNGDKSSVDIIVALGGGANDVVRLLEREGYPNIYCSENWAEGNEWLRNGKLPEAFCDELAQMQMTIHGDITGKDKIIHLCCQMPDRPRIAFADTPEETYDRLFGLRAKCAARYIYKQGNDGAPEIGFACGSCNYIAKKDHLWSYSPFITWVNLTPMPSPCQCRCIYCDREKTLYRWVESEEVRAAYERFFAFVEYGKSSGLIAKSAIWQISPGEITIHPYRERFLALARDTNAYLLSNGFLFDKEISQILHDNPHARFNVSLDSGTAATWEKIKGFDNFHTVQSNLERYAADCYDPGVQLELKFIVLPGINDRDEEYRGFVSFAKRIGVQQASLSRDCTGNIYHGNPAVLAASARLMSFYRANGMKVGSAVFAPDEMEEIRRQSDKLLAEEPEEFIV